MIEILVLKTFYHTLVWQISSTSHVKAFDPLPERCLRRSHTSVSIKLNNQIIVVNKITHALSIFARRLTSKFPNYARIILKTFLTEDILELEPEECTLRVSLVKGSRKVYNHLFGMKKVKVQDSFNQLGVKDIFQRGRNSHYVFVSQRTNITWHQTDIFCKETLNATSLSYYSQKELTEMSLIFPGDAYITFSGFQKMQKVLISFIFLANNSFI